MDLSEQQQPENATEATPASEPAAAVEPAAEQAPVPPSVPAAEEAPASEAASAGESAPAVETTGPAAESTSPASTTPARKGGQDRPPKQGGQRQGQRPAGEQRPPKDARGGQPSGAPQGKQGKGGDRRQSDPSDRRQPDTGRGPRGDRRGDGRRPEGPLEIEYDKLVSDSLYLDNQAHALVARLRDLDAGTRSQLRRLYGAVRRACRAAETDRQHQFVMLRARLAYTIARHGLRSLDPLEKLLLQVTRRNESRGYDRFRDLFEAIIAYNE